MTGKVTEIASPSAEGLAMTEKLQPIILWYYQIFSTIRHQKSVLNDDSLFPHRC